MDPQAFATLQAERACERLVLDYAAFNDAGDWDAVAALYVATGRMSRPTAPDDFIEGRDAILAAFKARPPRTTRHVCANIRVSLVDADTAHVASQILLFTGADQLAAGWQLCRCVRADRGRLALCRAARQSGFPQALIFRPDFAGADARNHARWCIWVTPSKRKSR